MAFTTEKFIYLLSQRNSTISAFKIVNVTYHLITNMYIHRWIRVGKIISIIFSKDFCILVSKYVPEKDENEKARIEWNTELFYHNLLEI